MIEFLSHLPNCYRLLLATQVFKRIEGLKVFFFLFTTWHFPRNAFRGLVFFLSARLFRRETDKSIFLQKETFKWWCISPENFFPCNGASWRQAIKGNLTQNKNIWRLLFIPFSRIWREGERGGHSEVIKEPSILFSPFPVFPNARKIRREGMNFRFPWKSNNPFLFPVSRPEFRAAIFREGRGGRG